MSLTPSTMLELGTQAPDFSLPDTDGKKIALKDLPKDKPLLVVFICNHCPYVIHIRTVLFKLAAKYENKGIAVVAINANDAENYPEDSPKKMAQEKKAAGFTFPYLFDATQEVAKAYKAACTPDFFLFDKNRKLVYRGQFDDSRPGNKIPVTGQDLAQAMDLVLGGKNIPEKNQKPSVGCSIKWKTGNEPEYF